MKVAIISSQKSLNTADLMRAIEQLPEGDGEGKVFSLKDLAFAVDTLNDHPFFHYDVYLFRGYNNSYAFAQALAQTLVRRGKTVIDNALTSGFIPSKFHEALVYKDANIAHIPTYSARQFQALQDSGFDNVYPVVVKDVDSQRGRGVRLCHDEDELRSEIERYGDTIIIQTFLTLDYDLRVICVGDTILGAVKREAVSDDFRTNVSLGGKVTSYELNEAEKELALKAHYAMGYDVSGVDIAHQANGTPVVIETNITPEWQGFQSATDIDVAAKIIEYAQERYSHEQKV